MKGRILLAGVIGGVLMFVGGFVTHMLFGWSGRAFSPLKGETELRKTLGEIKLEPGVYALPDMPRGVSGKEQEVALEAMTAKFKEGPSAFIVIYPTGQEMMDGALLGTELLSNIVAAILMAWVVAQFGADRDFLTRWLAVIAMGVISWAAIAWSFGIWYRFPQAFIRDELLCAVVDNALAGLAIAALCKRTG